MLILNSLAPVFVIIGMGFALTRSGFITPALQEGLNRLAYWVGLPALLFYKTVEADFSAGPGLVYLRLLLITTGSCMLLGIVVARLLRLPLASAGAMIQASFRGNLAYVALAIILFFLETLPDLPSGQADQIVTASVLALVPTVVIFNFVSVTLLVFCGPRSGKSLWRDTLFHILVNPLVLGCVAGIAWNLLALPLPVALGRTCNALGEAALPMALLGIGSQLAQTSIRTRWIPALCAGLIKTGAAPLLGYALATRAGLQGAELKAVLILICAPTAIASYVLADQMKCDPDLAASAALVCTVLSIVSFSVVIGLT